MWKLFLTFISHICINCVQHLLMSDLHPTRPQQYGGRQPEPQLSMDWHNWQAWLNCAQWYWKYLLCVCDILIQPVQLHILYNYSWSSDTRETRSIISLTVRAQHQRTSSSKPQTYNKSSRLSDTLVCSTTQIYSIVNFDHHLQVYLQAYFIFIYHPPHKETVYSCSFVLLEPGNCWIVWMK